MSTTRRIINATNNKQQKDLDRQRLVHSTEPDYFDDEETPLEKHIQYFGGDRKDITFSSIKEKNMQLGDGVFTATVNATLVAGGAGAKINGCPFSMFNAKRAVGILNHPMSSGIFNLDGTINENRWNYLLTYAQKRLGKADIITEKRFYDFLNSCRQLETRRDSFKVGLLASNAEWEAFFNKFAFVNNAGVRYVTVPRLRKFFEDSQQVGMEVESEISTRKRLG